MYTKNTTQPATISFPLTGLKPLYSSELGKKLVLEVDVDSLKKINEPNTIDEMVAEARLEYYAGQTKGFTDTKKLMNYLNA
ncbi:hypothetical protein KKC16_00460 [Patescibacteria group bacterium]|nr:hypothetical protein [Patescibacteria group bacterium]MBU4481914.1 hypothetical protein [Patescibacteria group bacterium]